MLPINLPAVIGRWRRLLLLQIGSLREFLHCSVVLKMFKAKKMGGTTGIFLIILTLYLQNKLYSSMFLVDISKQCGTKIFYIKSHAISIKAMPFRAGVFSNNNISLVVHCVDVVAQMTDRERL